MEPTTDNTALKASQREELRQRLLKLIVKNEARRRQRREMSEK